MSSDNEYQPASVLEGGSEDTVRAWNGSASVYNAGLLVNSHAHAAQQLPSTAKDDISKEPELRASLAGHQTSPNLDLVELRN